MSKTLKIVIVIDCLDGFFGGGMISTIRILSLIRENHDITVVSSDPESEVNRSVPKYYPPLPRIKKLMDYKGFVFAKPDKKILYDVIKQADLVHVQLPFMIGQKAISIARELDKPAVSTCHILAEVFFYNLRISGPLAKKIINAYFLRFVYNKSDRVICPSEHTLSELKKHGLKVPAEIISNGITKKYRPDYSIKRSNIFTILSTGRFDPEKRLDLLVEAVMNSKYAKEIRLVIAGKGLMEDRVRFLAQSLPGETIIKYYDEDNLIKLYKTANLYIHTSEVENESLSILEAIGCGLTPLISNSKTSAAKKFAHNESFLFRSGDSLDLAEKIDYWFEHPDELSQWHKETARMAEEYYICHTINKLEKLYYSCVTNKNYPP